MKPTIYSLFILVIYVLFLHLSENTQASEIALMPDAAVKQSDEATHPAHLANFVRLEGATYREFSAYLEDSRVPPSASDLWVSSSMFIDGHQLFIRYVAPHNDFVDACGKFCNDSNLVTKMPALWTTSHDMETPQWFNMGTINDNLQVWLAIDAVPHTSEIDGKEVPCGYKRATGVLIGRHIPTNTTYISDFSTQWYRVGCGG